MPISTFNGLNIALSGLQAEQASLDTTSHNIANASTVGYSRQVSELAAKPALGALSVWGMITPGQLGQGVQVADVARIRDQFNDNNLRTAFSHAGRGGRPADDLAGHRVRAAGAGLDTACRQRCRASGRAWQNVSTTPEDSGARQALAQSAQALGESFQTASTTLTVAARGHRLAGERDGLADQRGRQADRGR